MDQKTFDALVEETISSIKGLLLVKGGEYAGSDDRLANFKRGASLVGVSPLQCLFIYLSKHYDAFATYVRDAAAGTTRPRSEGIEGRLDDLINYCILAKGLVREEAELVPPSGWFEPYMVRYEDGAQELVASQLLLGKVHHALTTEFIFNHAERLVVAISTDSGATWIKLH